MHLSSWNIKSDVVLGNFFRSYIYIYIYIYICSCVSVCMCMWVSVSVYVSAHEKYACVCVCVCVCVLTTLYHVCSVKDLCGRFVCLLIFPARLQFFMFLTRCLLIMKYMQCTNITTFSLSSITNVIIYQSKHHCPLLRPRSGHVCILFK